MEYYARLFQTAQSNMKAERKEKIVDHLSCQLHNLKLILN